MLKSLYTNNHVIARSEHLFHISPPLSVKQSQHREPDSPHHYSCNHYALETVHNLSESVTI